MTTREVARQIKDHLIDLAVKDELPTDMNALDIEGIVKILNTAVALNMEIDGRPTAYSFTIEDVIEHGKQNGIRVSKNDAIEIIGLMQHKAELPVGWETVEYFTDLYFEEKKKERKAARKKVKA